MPLTEPTLSVGNCRGGRISGAPCSENTRDRTGRGEQGRIDFRPLPGWLARRGPWGSEVGQLTLRHALDALPTARGLANGPALPSFCIPAAGPSGVRTGVSR